MQKILTKAIRHHAESQNLKSTAVKGAEKVGGKRTAGRARGVTRGAARVATGGAKK